MINEEEEFEETEDSEHDALFIFKSSFFLLLLTEYASGEISVESFADGFFLAFLSFLHLKFSKNKKMLKYFC